MSQFKYAGEMQKDQATAALRRVYFLLVDATDGITAETGEGSGQPEISQNGGAFVNTTNTLVHISDGYYYVELTAAEVDTLGKVLVRYKSANTLEQGVELDVVARLGDIVFDSTYTTAESFGKRMRALGEPDGTAQAGASTSITLAAGASAVDDYYNGGVIQIQEGTGAGQPGRVITDYNGSTKVATVYPAWATAPDATSEYFILSGHSTVADIQATPRDAIRDAVTGDVIEAQGSYTMQQALSVILAAVAGRSSNGGRTFATPNNAATRIVSATDSSGNRTAITLTPSA